EEPPSTAPPHHTQQYCRPPKWTRTDSNGQSGLQKRSSVPTCPPSKPCTPQESGNGQEKSLQTPHTSDTNYSNSSPLVDATDHCSPKPPDTKTVSSQIGRASCSARV